MDWWVLGVDLLRGVGWLLGAGGEAGECPVVKSDCVDTVALLRECWQLLAVPAPDPGVPWEIAAGAVVVAFLTGALLASACRRNVGRSGTVAAALDDEAPVADLAPGFLLSLEDVEARDQPRREARRRSPPRDTGGRQLLHQLAVSEHRR